MADQIQGLWFDYGHLNQGLPDLLLSLYAPPAPRSQGTRTLLNVLYWVCIIGDKHQNLVWNRNKKAAWFVIINLLIFFTYLRILSGIFTYSIGISSLSSAKVLTYFILLLNFELKHESTKINEEYILKYPRSLISWQLLYFTQQQVAKPVPWYTGKLPWECS